MRLLGSVHVISLDLHSPYDTCFPLYCYETSDDTKFIVVNSIHERRDACLDVDDSGVEGEVNVVIKPPKVFR